MKHGAFNRCENCGGLPRTDNELMLSLAFTDHYFQPDRLEQIGRDVKAGKTPQLAQSLKDKLAPAINEAKVMIGIERPAAKSEAPKRRGLFYSPGLTWPFLAAVAALIIIWTMLVINMKLVPSRESPLVYGLALGLLSGVVLFAIMRAFDRSRSR
jgi:hypothetical protein